MGQPISRPAREGRLDHIGTTVGIKRFGSSVQINLSCDCDYHAIELYDRLVKSAKNGAVEIDLKASQIASDKD